MTSHTVLPLVVAQRNSNITLSFDLITWVVRGLEPSGSEKKSFRLSVLPDLHLVASIVSGSIPISFKIGLAISKASIS